MLVIVLLGIYELVRHDVKPGLVSQFEFAAQQGFSSRLSHDYPKPLGMWQCEFGPAQRGIAGTQYLSNKRRESFNYVFFDFLVFSLFPHVNLEERAKHRAVIMTEDKEWREAC